MYSPETAHPPTRITDLLNPVGGPVSALPLPHTPTERGHVNVLPGFAAIERAATGPRPPDYSLTPVVQTSASHSTVDEAPPAPRAHGGSSPRSNSDRQQHVQFSLRAASWESSNGASVNMHGHYGNGHPTVPSLQARQIADGASDGYLQLQAAMFIIPFCLRCDLRWAFECDDGPQASLLLSLPTVVTRYRRTRARRTRHGKARRAYCHRWPG